MGEEKFSIIPFLREFSRLDHRESLVHGTIRNVRYNSDSQFLTLKAPLNKIIDICSPKPLVPRVLFYRQA